jgi:hypothetical protein
MNWCKFVVALSFLSLCGLASAQSADTLDIVGGYAGSWGFGWFGEAWKGTAWCGDTISKDLHPDTTSVPDTTVSYTDLQYIDTVKSATDTQYITIDSLVPDTTYSHHLVINDTTKVDTCSQGDFTTDTGGLTPGVTYINYYYKFRNSFAQMPIVWNSWGGWDSLKTVSYKYLLIVYKGLLPTHQASLNFFYATWSYPFDSARHATDSIKNSIGAGDGVGILQPSPDAWDTVVIKIPDSVNLVRITGLTFSIGGNAQTSPVGNLKVARISLLPDLAAVRNRAALRIGKTGKFGFIPKNSGKVTFSIYSLKGGVLFNKTIDVEANRLYSMSQFVQKFSNTNSKQIRMVRIQGQGVNINEKIW